MLDPKQVIVKLKRYMHEGGGRTIEGKALHGDVISADELWGCTTCGACLEVCPARIDIVDTLVDLRRISRWNTASFRRVRRTRCTTSNAWAIHGAWTRPTA